MFTDLPEQVPCAAAACVGTRGHQGTVDVAPGTVGELSVRWTLCTFRS